MYDLAISLSLDSDFRQPCLALLVFLSVIGVGGLSLINVLVC